MKNEGGVLDAQRLWSLKECTEHFHDAINSLKEEAKSGDGVLVWDKVIFKLLDLIFSLISTPVFFFTGQ